MKHTHSIVKMVAVTILATYISYLLGITHYLSAGILAMISIQKTKSLSLNIAGKRTILVFISLLLSTALFLLIGYSLSIYFIFVLIIVFISFQFKLQAGTIPSVVVVTQLFAFGQFSVPFMLETILMYFLSIGISLLFNLFYPSESLNDLDKYRHNLDTTIKEHLVYLREKIEFQKPSCKFTFELEKKIEVILENINQVTGDLIMKNHQDILEYSKMRNKQFDILKNICNQSDKLQKQYPQTKVVISYLDSLSNNIGVKDYATNKLEEIDTLLDSFKEEKLPIDRDEFEHRAILFYIMLEIRQFLLLKTEYHSYKLQVI
ncbi:MAG: aromatic acid exporter family protein [Tenericutes bacterium]|nr:aromatic acid exporter family protein [Mycoplasmatota bacterium]